MNASGIILRETMVSIAVNGVLSLLFFLLAFGLEDPITLKALATDFFPQSFMIALMGTLVPSLIVRRKLGGALKPIVRRSLLLAVAAAVLGGGGTFALCRIEPLHTLAPWTALAIKTAYGAALAAIVTPIAVGALFKTRTISP